MKLLVVQVIILIGVTYARVVCSGEGDEDEYEEPVRLSQPVRACSRYLSCLMDRVCSNSVKLIKRDTSPFMNKLVPDDLKVSSVITEGPIRSRRQVIDECCLNSCNVEKLVEYCSAGSKVFDYLPLLLDET